MIHNVHPFDVDETKVDIRGEDASVSDLSGLSTIFDSADEDDESLDVDISRMTSHSTDFALQPVGEWKQLKQVESWDVILNNWHCVEAKIPIVDDDSECIFFRGSWMGKTV